MSAPVAIPPTLAALLLLERGFLPWPLRYETLTHKTADWGIRQLLTSANAERYARALLDRFETACMLEILTGNVAGIVAIRTWTLDGEVVVGITAPASPIIVVNASGRYHLYRHPGFDISSEFIHPPMYYGVRTALQVLGNANAVVIPASTFDRLDEWPGREDLPRVNLDALRGGLA